MASKYLVDEGEFNEIYNEDWASVSKLSIERVNKLEKQMLFDLVSVYNALNVLWFNKFITLFRIGNCMCRQTSIGNS